MTVSRSSWPWKVYAWWYARKYGRTPSDRSNLCPYMRAVMFWSWMRFLFKDGMVGKLPIPIVAWLALALEIPRWVGIVSYEWKFVILVFYTCAMAAGVIMGAIFLLQRWVESVDRVNLPELKKFNKAVREFTKLVVAYSEAAHTRICPELEFKEEN